VCRFVLAAFAALVLATPAQAALTLSYETYRWVDRTPTISGDDGCLDEDDTLDWAASGTLAPGEQFTFRPAAASCQSRVAHGFFLVSGKRRQDHPLIEVTATADWCDPYSPQGCPIPTVTVTDDGAMRQGQYECAGERFCWRGSWCVGYHGSMSWNQWTGEVTLYPNTVTTTVRNVGDVEAVAVRVQGQDDGPYAPEVPASCRWT